MNYQLYDSYGTIEAVIDDNCGMTKFYKVADALSSALQIYFLVKSEEFEHKEWVFIYKEHLLKLHYNIYRGISLTPGNIDANNIVIELAQILKLKLF